MEHIKVGSKLNQVGTDGTETRCQVIQVGEAYTTVKWLEARWNLRENIMLNRKGTISQVATSSLR